SKCRPCAALPSHWGGPGLLPLPSYPPTAETSRFPMDPVSFRFAGAVVIISTVKQTESQKVVAAEVVVSGRVQGVCYRAFTQEAALDLGLGGWVRNLPDGRVEAQVEG